MTIPQVPSILSRSPRGSCRCYPVRVGDVAQSYRQIREVTGLDYSLVDYQGVLAAAGRFALAWWLQPLRALESQAELIARTCTCLEHQYQGGNETEESRFGVDKRFLDPTNVPLVNPKVGARALATN